MNKDVRVERSTFKNFVEDNPWVCGAAKTIAVIPMVPCLGDNLNSFRAENKQSNDIENIRKNKPC